jgi:hypothetical protein
MKTTFFELMLLTAEYHSLNGIEKWKIPAKVLSEELYQQTKGFLEKEIEPCPTCIAETI